MVVFLFQIHQYLEPDDDAEAGQQKNVPDSTISKDLSSLFSRRIEASGQKATCRRLTLGSKRLMAQRAVGYIGGLGGVGTVSSPQTGKSFRFVRPCVRAGEVKLCECVSVSASLTLGLRMRSCPPPPPFRVCCLLSFGQPVHGFQAICMIILRIRSSTLHGF